MDETIRIECFAFKFAKYLKARVYALIPNEFEKPNLSKEIILLWQIFIWLVCVCVLLWTLRLSPRDLVFSSGIFWFWLLF